MPPDASTALPRLNFASTLPAHQTSQELFKPKRSLTVLALVAAAHVFVIVALLSLKLVAAPLPEVITIVNIVMPSAPPQPKIVPPKALPVSAKVQPQVLQNKPVIKTLVIASETPSPITLAAEVSPPANTASVSTSPIAAPAPAPAAPPAVPSAPRFDADYLDNPAPVYPPLSRRTNEEGKVMLRVFVEANGSPSRLEIQTSSGYERLDKAALAAVSRWKFAPARLGNDSIGAWVLVPIIFSLKS